MDSTLKLGSNGPIYGLIAWAPVTYQESGKHSHRTEFRCTEGKRCWHWHTLAGDGFNMFKHNFLMYRWRNQQFFWGIRDVSLLGHTWTHYFSASFFRLLGNIAGFEGWPRSFLGISSRGLWEISAAQTGLLLFRMVQQAVPQMSQSQW